MASKKCFPCNSNKGRKQADKNSSKLLIKFTNSERYWKIHLNINKRVIYYVVDKFVDFFIAIVFTLSHS